MINEYKVLSEIMNTFSKGSDLPVSFECQRDCAANFKNAVKLTSLLELTINGVDLNMI